MPSSDISITISKYKGNLGIPDKVIETKTEKSIRLRQGKYVVKYSSSGDYKDLVEVIDISKPTELNAPILSFSDTKLDQMFTALKPEIKKELNQSINTGEYMVVKEKLLFTGDWYAAALLPNSWYKSGYEGYIPRPLNPDNNKDAVKVIIKKEGGQWKVVTKPSIVFYINDYPNIPEDVIRETNKLGFISN